MYKRQVKGLRKDDFTVKEDKKEQHIVSFEYFGSAQTFAPPKLPLMPANTFINLPKVAEQGPLYILYYDMVNTETDDQMAFHKPVSYTHLDVYKRQHQDQPLPW